VTSVAAFFADANGSEKAKLPERLELASEIIKSFGTAGLENTMTTFNGK
jgi:PTH1 family peptidyl-tRNA hydrolase